MSGMERAAIAREVLTELMTWEGTQSVEAVQAAARFMSEHYPAPPAPETVTVTVDGKTYIRDKLGDWYDEAGMRWYSSEYTGPFLRRIAELESEIVNSNKHQTDEITALQRRIAELEAQVMATKVYDSPAPGDDLPAITAVIPPDETVIVVGGVSYRADWPYWRVGERVIGHGSEPGRFLRRIAELEQGRERVTGLGASTTEEGHVERSSTAAPAHRTMSQGEGLGAAAPKREREAGAGSSTPVAAPKIHSHSPAPIPLGATVEVEGTRWTLGTSADDEEWCTDDGDVTHTHDHDAALAALYRALHPVATRETVELVRSELLDTMLLAPYHRAQTLLVAAGFTLEEGA